MTISFDDVLAAQAIPELMIARRAFPATQELFSRPVARVAASAAQIGWFDTEVCAEGGAVAVVAPDGPLADLVGEIVAVKLNLATEVRGVFVYVVGRAPVVEDLSLSRRAFLELAFLSTEALECSVEVLS